MSIGVNHRPHHVALPLRLNQGKQRMKGAKRVPQTIIVFVMWLVRLPPDVFARQIVWHVMRAIKRGVKYPTLFVGSTVHCNMRKGFFPGGFRVAPNFRESMLSYLAIEICSC